MIQHGRRNKIADDGKFILFKKLLAAPRIIVPFHFVLISSILIYENKERFVFEFVDKNWIKSKGDEPTYAYTMAFA